MKPIYGSTLPPPPRPAPPARPPGLATSFHSWSHGNRCQITQSTELEKEGARDQKKRRALGTRELENAQKTLRIHYAYLGGSFVCSWCYGFVVPLLDFCASTKVRKTSFRHIKEQQIGIYRYCLFEVRKSCLIQGCSQPIMNLQDRVYEFLVWSLYRL